MRHNAHQSDNNTVSSRKLKETILANARNERFSLNKQNNVYKQGIPQNFQSSEIYDL